MCGIAGFRRFSQQNRIDIAVLQRMNAVLAHRGPDGHGHHTDGQVGLAHTRLSIIDLEGGAQPMPNEDQSLWVTFNGEIFNYVELRADLIRHGHTFRTTSDTEVILHLYEEVGPACVEAFNGDFAFALWDEPRKRLMLARDRMGVRPLYYTETKDALIFASEIKALLTYPGMRAELDPVALDQCFTFWFPIAPRTPFKGIRELPPGHLLLVEPERTSLHRYWSPDYSEANGRRPVGKREEAELEEELRELLSDAVKIRLRADVPVGAYLSGGLDSSLITALIHQVSPDRLSTFSIGFDSKEFDEREFQQEMVRALGTDHRTIACAAADIGRIFPDVVLHTERPLLRTAPAPMFQLAERVKHNGCKVVLTGEGADEIFAGYDIFKEAKIRRFWARQPQSVVRPLLLQRLYPYLPGLQGVPHAYLEGFFRTGIDRPDDPFFSHRPRWETTSRIKSLFSSELRRDLEGYDAITDLHGQLPAAYGSWHSLSQAQYLETAHLLPGYILSSQGDRMAMAHGVEGRFPFLDPRVIQFASRLPHRLLMKVLTEKYLLRNSMRDLLPRSILERRKQPYRAPDAQCFFGASGLEYVDALLSPGAIADAGCFDAKAVDRLVAKCRKQPSIGARDSMALVGLLSVQLLHHQFVTTPVCHNTRT